MKNLELGCWMLDSVIAGSDHVNPLSEENDSMIPFVVRAVIHHSPPSFSTIIASCQDGFGKERMPRNSQLSPWFVESSTFPPRSGPHLPTLHLTGPTPSSPNTPHP